MARKATSRTAPAKKKAPTKKAAATKPPAANAATKAAATKKKAANAATKAAATKKAATTKPTTKKATKKKAATKKAETTKTAARPTTTRGRGPGARSPFSVAFLTAQREALLEERATYLGQAETLQAEAESLVADVDPGDVQFDEESGEGDTLAVERERDLALSAQARQAVEEIDHALEKLDQGTYGLCEVDQVPIPEERLEAIPWARTCVQHKIGGFGRR